MGQRGTCAATVGPGYGWQWTSSGWAVDGQGPSSGQAVDEQGRAVAEQWPSSRLYTNRDVNTDAWIWKERVYTKRD